MVLETRNYLRNQNFSVFTSFFKLAYYTAVIPFRFTYNTNANNWEVKYSRFQKIICLWLTWPIFAVYAFADSVNILTIFYQLQTLSPKLYFQTFGRLAHFFKMFLFLRILTSNPIAILKLTNYQRNVLESNFATGNSNSIMRVKLYLHFVFILMAFNQVTYFSFRYHPSTSILSPSEYFHQFVVEGRKRLHLSTASGTCIFTKTNLILGAAEFILVFDNFLLNLIFEIFSIGPLPLCLWFQTSEIQDKIKSLSMKGNANVDKSFYEIVQEFLDFRTLFAEKLVELQKYSHEFNLVWSPLILFWILEYAARQISAMNGMIQTKSIFDVGTIFSKSALFVIALYLYADTYRKVGNKAVYPYYF